MGTRSIRTTISRIFIYLNLNGALLGYQAQYNFIRDGKNNFYMPHSLVLREEEKEGKKKVPENAAVAGLTQIPANISALQTLKSGNNQGFFSGETQWTGVPELLHGNRRRS